MKTKKIITIIAVTIPTCIIIFSAFFKLTNAPVFAEAYAKAEITDFLVPLGLAEIIFLALFLYPKTFKIGFFLLCSYLGAAIMAHLAHNDIAGIKDGVLVLTMIWIAAFLRDRSMFLPVNDKFIQG